MSEELVVLNNTQIAQLEDNGNWGDDADEIRPQWISIKQPSTENVDHIANGSFFHKASGQTWKEIDMVILQISKQQFWKPSAPNFVKGEKVVCRSNNRKTPITGNGLVPQSTDCKSCKHNSWAGYDKINKTGPKPACAKDTFILFIDRETELPYIFDATGLSVDPADVLKDTLFQQATLEKKKSGKMPSSFHFLVTVTTEKDGRNYKLKVSRIAKLTEEAAAKFGPLYLQFVASRTQPVVEEPVEGGTTYYEAEDTGQILDSEPAVAI